MTKQKQPPTHSTCRNGDGSSSSGSRHDMSQAAGMFHYFTITHYTNFFRFPLQVKMAMAVVVAAATASATAEGIAGAAGGT